MARLWEEPFDWEGAAASVWWLDTCVVLYPRQGIFKKLFHHIYALAQATPEVVKFRLHVHRLNNEAIAAYEALGFKSDSHMMHICVRRYQWRGINYRPL